MNKLNYEILSAIDNIETTVMESEINVINSLIDSYDKAMMVLECCDDNTDVDSFDIFQESVIMEADETNTNDGVKPKKTVGEMIIDFLLFIPRLIKKAFLIVKHKLDKIFGPLKEAIVNKVKKLFGKVDGEPVDVEIVVPNDGGTPEVTVITASHDTEKEEQIKSKIQSVISVEVVKTSPASSNQQSGVNNDTVFNTNALSSTNNDVVDITPVSTTKSTTTVDTPQDQQSSNNTNTTIKISSNDIEVEFLNYSKTVDNISFRCKKISEIFANINIERMSELKYNQEFAKSVNNVIIGISKDHVPGTINKKTYSEFVNYTNNMKASLDASMNTLKRCGDTLDKSIMMYKNKNKLNNMPEKAIKGEAKLIIKSINLIKRSIQTFIELSLVSADVICQEYARVNKIISQLASSNGNTIVESYYDISDEEIVQEFFFTTEKNIKKRMMKYFPDFLDDIKRLNEAREEDELTMGMVSRMYKSDKTSYRTRNTSDDGTYSIEMDRSYEIQTKHMKTLLAVNEYCDKACSRKRCEGAFTTSERQDIFELNEQIEKFYYDLLDLFADESEKSLFKINKDIGVLYPLAKKVYGYID